MSSGRSAPLSGIAAIKGPLVRMLPVFYIMNTSDTFVQATKNLQAQLVQTMEHEHDVPYVGLKDMPAVFDFEPETDARTASTFSLEPLTTVDRIGYPLSIRVSYSHTKISILATSETRTYSSESLTNLLRAMVENVSVACMSNGTVRLNVRNLHRQLFVPARPLAPSTDLSALPIQLTDQLLNEGRRAPHAVAIVDVDSHGAERRTGSAKRCARPLHGVRSH